MSISNGKFQGVTRYYELNEKMISAHRRVVAGMGGQVFQEMVLDKFGLVLDDESVTSVATPLGWNSQWLGTRQARPPVPASHDITAMLNNAPTVCQCLLSLSVRLQGWLVERLRSEASVWLSQM